ncbi:MAG TPA: peptidoglycan-binding protein, partial [Gemmatimonadaceae bacterium]|nr:peptidoglycan-binding protein [Gemmatimonadaceae bacterium]
NMDEFPQWARGEYTFRAPIKRGDRGKRAKLVQEWLNLHNIRIVADGSFGAATEAGLKRFQEAHGLPATGSVDANTFNELTAPIRRALKPIPRGERSFNQLVIAYAEQHEKEHPREVAGQNRGPWVRLYMKGVEGEAYPWCAGFVSFIVKQAATTFDSKLEIPYTVSCDVIAVEGRHRGRFIAEREIVRMKASVGGGSVFLNRRSPSDWVHTGIVVQFNDETIETIEGNTNDTGSREGFEVVRRIRGYRSKDFVRLD